LFIIWNSSFRHIRLANQILGRRHQQKHGSFRINCIAILFFKAYWVLTCDSEASQQSYTSEERSTICDEDLPTSGENSLNSEDSSFSSKEDTSLYETESSVLQTESSMPNDYHPGLLCFNECSFFVVAFEV